MMWPGIGEPPDAGAAHARVTFDLPGVAVSPAGAPGTVAGTAFAPADAGPSPTRPTADTRKIIGGPLPGAAPRRGGPCPRGPVGAPLKITRGPQVVFVPAAGRAAI